MITLLKCEFMKTRHCYLFITALVITAMCLGWSLHGEVTPELSQHGWRMFLYQFPLVNAIFLPLLAMVIASKLCQIEYKSDMLKALCCTAPRGKLYDAKMIYGLGIITACVILMWTITVGFGLFHNFQGDFPLNLYLLYLLFTLVPTMVIYLFQHTLSLLFKNPAVAFFIGILGEFAGIFSMFLPAFPWLRRSLLWGYYGVLQFVGLFGWTKETRYAGAHFDVLPIDWQFFGVLIAAGVALYLIGKYLFYKKEV